MTGTALRMQLRMQQQRNNAVASGATEGAFVAPTVAADGADAIGRERAKERQSTSGSHHAVLPVPDKGETTVQQAMQQPHSPSIESPYENLAVARCMHRVVLSATDGAAHALNTLAVVHYSLLDAKGGTLIDPNGPATAIRELHWRFGARVDWRALLAMFEARAQAADREAADLIRRLTANDCRDANGP
jgi:hypothetical protein